jgi:hypothetical protein
VRSNDANYAFISAENPKNSWGNRKVLSSLVKIKRVGSGEASIGGKKLIVDFFCMANSIILKYRPPNSFFVSN